MQLFILPDVNQRAKTVSGGLNSGLVQRPDPQGGWEGNSPGGFNPW